MAYENDEEATRIAKKLAKTGYLEDLNAADLIGMGLVMLNELRHHLPGNSQELVDLDEALEQFDYIGHRVDADGYIEPDDDDDD